jgi:hypothetical protein
MNSSFRSAPQPSSSGGRKKDPVFPMGGHAYINAASSDQTEQQTVPLSDKNGLPLDNDLRDGEEVEILGWNPRSIGGLAYEVRRLTDKREWWVRSQYLRTSSERARVAKEK